MSSNIRADRRLIDTDQGVCPDGHDCALVEREDGTFARACGEPHSGELGTYIGWPLVRLDLTEAEVNEAEAAGAEPDLIYWARESLGWEVPA